MSRKFSAKLYVFIFFIAVFSAQAQTATHKTPFDFDGDNKTDLTVYRPSNSAWYIFQSQSQTSRSEIFGVSTDRIVPGDYDGDGKDDLAVFRPTDQIWYMQQSRDGFRFQQWGLSGDLPFAGDYDGDGKTDLVVIRSGPDGLLTWHILQSTTGYRSLTYGNVGDIPVRGDFDGDHKADIAVWRPTDGGWYYRKSSNNQDIAQLWGMGSLGDMVSAGDYDGDDKTDLAVWRSGTGVWYVLQSSNNTTVSFQFGGSTYGDVPVPGDYDGDGKYDYAVWRVADGVWHIQRSLLGYTAQQWGSTAHGDKLAPFAFVSTGTVVGTVKSDADLPVEGALIEVAEQGVLKAVTTSSSTGYFFLPGVRTGQYEIRVSYKSANASTDCSTDAYQDARLNGIGLLAGGTTTVNVTLAKHKVCFEDNFDGAPLGSLWQKGLIDQSNYNDINVSIVNQSLEIAVPAASPTPTPPERFSGIRTVSGNYNLRDAYVTARFVKAPIETNYALNQSEARLEVGINSANKIRVTVSDSLILWKVVGGGLPIELRNIGFSRVTKGYIRIRFKHEPEVGFPTRGRLFLETSQTGTDGSWINENVSGVGIIFDDFDLSSVRVSLSAGSWRALSNPTKAIIDDFKFAKYNALAARAGDDQMLGHNNFGPSLSGSYECAGCTNISNVSYKWTLASKPVGAPDPTISSATSASASLSNINFPGSYNFQFTVKATYSFGGQSYTSASTDTVRVYRVEAPVSRITAADSVMEDEPIVFDGSLSSGAHEHDWSFGDGRKAEIPRATHLYMAPGNYTVTLKVKSELCSGLTTAQCELNGGASTASKTITVTPLPAATTVVTLPACVPETANQTLRNAVDSASGRTDIVLRAGCDYGSINLPHKDSDDYIVLRSNGSLPPKGTRISPSYIANMAVISTSSIAPAMTNAAAAHHYRFIGILFRRGLTYTGEVRSLIELQAPSPGHTELSNMPHHLIFDRCFFSNIPVSPSNPDPIDFDPYKNLRMRRGIALNTRSATVINSYFKEIKDAGTDSQSIACWTGVGPHAIVNNYLESAGQGIMYGGDHMSIQYASPSDITMRGNYFFKPLRWNNATNEPEAKAKNIFELKHAVNVIFDGNAMQNSLARNQQADAIVLAVGDDLLSNPWTTIRDVQITNNLIDFVGRGVNISGIDYNSPTIPASHFIIRNNLWTRVGDVVQPDGSPTEGRFVMISGMPDRLWIVDNTVFQKGSVLYAYATPRFTYNSGFRFDNNIMKHNTNGFDGADSASSNGFDFLNTYALGWMMRRNVIFFPPGKENNIGLYPDSLTNSNSYPLDSAGYPLFLGQFVNVAQGNYRLLPGSPGDNWAVDGSDAGCDIDQLDAATGGSVAGTWTLP
jgi:hypothetical protein